MPAAVNRNKVLFELEGTGEAVDLEGDVGVVGRLLSESNSMQMDLKGVVYNARILPTPASVVILAVNQTEAKVESVANDFVQLREDPNANTAGVGGTLDGYLGVDSDDEDHHVGRVAAGGAASAAVRAMDDVSDDEAGGKRKRGAGGAARRRGSSGRTGRVRRGRNRARGRRRNQSRNPRSDERRRGASRARRRVNWEDFDVRWGAQRSHAETYLRVFLVSNRFPDGSFSRLRRYKSPPFAHIYQRA